MEVSKVLTEMAGKGVKHIRIANLPPEVPDAPVKAVLAPYGKIIIMRNEVWSKTYCYTVPNEIRQIKM
jgi:hypothetical protein